MRTVPQKVSGEPFAERTSRSKFAATDRDEILRPGIFVQLDSGSGRHVLALHSELSFAGSNTPVYERFYAGGFASMRGFEFRGVGPFINGFNIGGDFYALPNACFHQNGPLCRGMLSGTLQADERSAYVTLFQALGGGNLSGK